MCFQYILWLYLRKIFIGYIETLQTDFINVILPIFYRMRNYNSVFVGDNSNTLF
jgi:hypothetical protein